MYCGECLNGSIPEPMVIIEKGPESKTFQCRACRKVVTLIVSQVITEDGIR